MQDLKLLRESLYVYITEWINEVNILKSKLPDQQVINRKVQLNSMIFLAQWIVNSINGDINRVHPLNICNIVLEEKMEK